MDKQLRRILAGTFALALAVLLTIPARAQMSEAKEKPPMYTYVADWSIPRAQWGDMAKNMTADQATLQKALSSGTIVAYGDDEAMVHQADGTTHDNWWSAMSMAGVLKVLDQFYNNGGATAPVLANATKHFDSIYVSRYYNWHSGSWKGVYTHGSTYTLKPDAPNNAVETVSKSFIVPFFEKLLADGTLHEYEVDTQAIHTESPSMFYLFYIASSAEALDKVNAALDKALKGNPLTGPAFASLVDFSGHRDDLAHTNATYK
jgi:hypothetical protein